MASTTQSVLLPPDEVRGMTVLDKSKFKKEISIPVLKVKVCMMHGIMSALSPYLLKMEKLRPIQEADSSEDKFICLNPDVVRDFDSFSRNVRNCLAEMDITKDDVCHRNLTLTYDNWKSHEIISAILPSGLNFAGYTVVGSIVHVNLRNELLPYGKIIGDVLREKIAKCRSVVNKVGIINTKYRNFEMDILSGDGDTKTEVKENGCRFEMDFAEVYWNSRLHEEHCRIINLLSEGDVLYDVFCGIGPFAIPAAKKGCRVLANDLNPASYRWLNRNVIINKVQNRVSTFNKDGQDFIKDNFKNDYLARIVDQNHANSKFHITMNLPSLADTFLPSFVKLFDEADLVNVPERLLPNVYLYCFFKNKTNFLVESKRLLEQALHESIADKINDEDVFHVRNVAPEKEMFRIRFTLSKEILTGVLGQNQSDYYPPVKKIKLDDVSGDNLEE